MLNEIIQKDPIAKFLFENSHFTETQLDTYLADRVGRMQMRSLNGRILMRDQVKLTKGSFMRTLRQAETNLLRSLYTILAAEYYGLLPEGTFESIAHLGDVLSETQRVIVEGEKIEKIITDLKTGLESVVRR